MRNWWKNRQQQRAIQRLRLEPGDVLVLRVPDRLGQVDAERLTQKLLPWFPGHQVLVLDSGASFEVVSPVPKVHNIGEIVEHLRTLGAPG